VSLLLSRSADTTVKNNSGFTAFDMVRAAMLSSVPIQPVPR
jgi:hypothetical protein